VARRILPDLNLAQTLATNRSGYHRLVAHSGAAIVRLFELLVGQMGTIVGTGLRLIIFLIPTALVARWCDVPLTWKSVAFVVFWSVWHGCVFGEREASARQDDRSAVDNRKASAEVMTPAQVAAEARKLAGEPKPDRS
jgi:hypothetical protein